ncbi:MAG TPA: HD-GYP domain-containing protein [Clostridia bacterium]|nr:HD-GYP domain-containing protein [Clostridia bacterium]
MAIKLDFAETKEGMMNKGHFLEAYIWIVILAGISFLLLVRPDLNAVRISSIVTFALVMFLTEIVSVSLPRGGGTVSVSFAVSLASIIALGPEATAWMSAIGSIRLKDLQGKIPLKIVLFNRAMLALVDGLAGMAYVAAGGKVGSFTFSRSFHALAVCAVCDAFLNVTLVALFIGLKEKKSPVYIWVSNIKQLMPNYVALAPVGLLVAIVYMAYGYIGITLFFAPLIVARYSFKRFLDMRQAYLETLRALAGALEARDEYTRGHSERVAAISTEIGKKLGLPLDKIELLEYVGFLHDVGKIGIRDSILRKPGILSAEEYAEMQKHSLFGAYIVSGISLLGAGAYWIKHHHEKYDGTGFPSNLSGTRIPIEARIISVADAYDAITSTRPYKRPMTYREALDELHRCSGAHFDPVVVSALEKAINDRVRVSPAPGVAN